MKKTIKVLFILMPIVLFVLLATFLSATIITNFESWAYTEITEHMSSVLNNIMIFITHIGDAIIVILICLGFFIIPKVRSKYAIPVSIGVVVSTILNRLLKSVFSRERPDILSLISETDYSFPSGHAMINITLYTIVIIITCKYVNNVKLKWTIIIGCSILTILIGFSRVYLGVHYITDIIGGWLIGFVVAIIIYLGWNKIIFKGGKYYEKM